jgi:transcriptional regulator with XRE-family HTH domain
MRFQLLKPRKDVASAEQVRALRERRCWTEEQLADEVHASPLEVSAWEAGAVRVPSKQALLIRWHTERAAWGEALHAALDRTCPWVRENAPDLYEQMFRKPAGSWYARNEPVRAHLAGCARCMEIWKEAQHIGGFFAKPDTSGSLSARYRHRVDRLPRWAAAPIVRARLFAPMAVAGLVMLTTDHSAAFGVHGGGVFLGVAFALSFQLLVTSTLVRRRTTALLEGFALGVGGMLGWALVDPLIDLGNPRHWAATMTAGCGVRLVQWMVDRLVDRHRARRKAKALTARSASGPALSPPPPDLAATLQRVTQRSPTS